MKSKFQYRKQLEMFLISFLVLIGVNILFVFLPSFWSHLLIGKTSLSLSFTFQDFMWMTFTIGLLLLKKLIKEYHLLKSFEESNYLPGDFETIIDDKLLTLIIKQTRKDIDKEMSTLPQIILQIALQFRTNQSISLTSDFLSKHIDSALHSVELRYNQLKYIIWLIPSVGFMGTVYGIGVAVNQLGKGSLDDPNLLTQMAGSLGIAFNTTLLALVLSVILQFLTQKYEAKEEEKINLFGKYILENLINRIVEKYEKYEK